MRSLLLVAVWLAAAAGAEEKVCESEFKALTAAGNALIPEIDGLVPKLDHEEMLSNTAELARMWRLVRNQQAAIDLSYKELNAAFSQSWRKAHGMKTIDTQDSKMLADVFFGGEPHFVQCAGKSDPVHRAFSEAAAPLIEAGISPSVMDCAEKMPSGKNVYERFFAKKNISEPFFFVVANRDTPRSLTFKSSTVAPDAIVKYGVDATAPQVYTITDTDDFDRYCLKRKACAVMLHEGELGKEDYDMFKGVAEKRRMAVFMTIDLKKLQPSFKDALPPANDRPRLVFLRQAKNEESESEKEKEKKTKSKPKWEGKAYKGKEWSAENVAQWVEDIHTGYMPLKSLKTVPNVIDPVKEQLKQQQQQQQQQQQDPRQRDTSAYGANLRYHQEMESRRLAQEERERKIAEELKAAKQAGAKGGAGGGGTEGARTGGGFKTTKVEKPKQETEAERRMREKKRREQMEKERHSADGIEFVGEDPQDGEPDDEGYYHLDPIEIDEDGDL